MPVNPLLQFLEIYKGKMYVHILCKTQWDTKRLGIKVPSCKSTLAHWLPWRSHFRVLSCSAVRCTLWHPSQVCCHSDLWYECGHVGDNQNICQSLKYGGGPAGTDFRQMLAVTRGWPLWISPLVKAFWRAWGTARKWRVLGINPWAKRRWKSFPQIIAVS